ncbi:MAG: hypothetical protein KC877_01275 [Candidatus Kaiserbacteria bacterium]|nr:hypothetical protein [Candidatus Kaiserbacteria bacterium]MCB9816536.1 hypothetical protein [Candidatus Nomurabacteria bacterium]
MPFFQNRYVKIIGFGLLGVAGLFVLLLLWGIMNLMVGSTDLGGNTVGVSAPRAPMFDGYMEADGDYSYNKVAEMESVVSSAPAPTYIPEPMPSSYTDNLETYETTSYAVSGVTKQFDELCDLVTSLKADTEVHFQSINTGTNYCRASFYVTEAKAESVVTSLSEFKNVSITRDTHSVTRHKQQLESQTAILQQQLVRIESSLTAAQAQLDRLNTIFYSSNDVTDLSNQVTNSLRYIDQLTSRKISLISQLDNIYQQAADLNARLEVVEFSVSVSRKNPIVEDKYENLWKNAWDDLKDNFVTTLINLTTTFGIFLLWVLQAIVYIAVLIVVLRGFWKFVKLLWSKW